MNVIELISCVNHFELVKIEFVDGWKSFKMLALLQPNHLPAMTVDDSMTNTQQQVYNGDHRKYFEFPCIVLKICNPKQNTHRLKQMNLHTNPLGWEEK